MGMSPKYRDQGVFTLKKIGLRLSAKITELGRI